MTSSNDTIEKRCINAIRFLAIDAIQQARSGHPGLPMGAAPMAFVLWDRFLRFNPKNPRWPNRDRFILSAGHGSMLQYALMHLSGFDGVSLDGLKRFRQLGSKTPGHPENTITPGVEVTTGPLGQGIANAVGMAIAERHLAARFNRPGHEIVSHRVFALMGDGCQMEGLASEACSLAGHLGLGNLIALYDDNHVTIDGPTDLAFTEDVAARFEAYGWHVEHVPAGDTDLDGIGRAIDNALRVADRPTLVRVRTTIGYGSPNKAGSADTHGSPLGASEVQATRDALGWPHAPFEVPGDVLDHMRRAVERGREAEAKWRAAFESYRAAYPEEAAILARLQSGALPEGWEAALPRYAPGGKPAPTRSLSGGCLNALSPVLPGLLGGSADLAPSNKTLVKGVGAMKRDAMGNRNIHFGVREHAMAAVCNGMALYGSGLIPYCGTFLVFSDYMRGAIRVSAISGAGVIYVMTHDSVAVGEDGPTHQPIEHLAALRAMPGLVVIRPADGNEVAGAYRAAISNRARPTLLALSRQDVPHLGGTSPDGVSRGAYVVFDETQAPELILIGTGAELGLCLEAAAVLTRDGIAVRVVSMPSFELFDEQGFAYQESVLPRRVTRRIAVEAGVSFGWSRHVGEAGAILGIDRFGMSAPGETCLAELGYTVSNVVAMSRRILEQTARG